MRKIAAVGAAVLCGLVILAGYVFQLPWLQSISARLLEGGVILACFALLLGVLNLLAYHLQRIGSHTSASWQSWTIIITLLTCLVIGLALPASGPLSWVYTYLITPLMATLGALLLFYGVLAAPRLMAKPNIAALLLLVSCLVFMVLWIPGISGLSPWIATIRNWLFTVPLGAGMRGILLGTAIGASVSALRLIFAVDKPFMANTGKR